MNKFYISTPIYYVNDKPHIGHAYTTILADVIARYNRLKNNQVFFLTGLDEHGQKVEEAAKKLGVNPKTHCDEMAPRFINLWNKLNISNDGFIRTTNSKHISVVKDILKTVYNNGDIYKDVYEGLYSVSEERFITEKEADSGEFRDIKKLKETNYFFKMSKYQNRLINHINENPLFIQPEYRKNEILGFLKKPLNDLCISRPKKRFNWGIDLPFDDNYVTYVWFDALINYISGIGYKDDKNSFENFWPCDIHLIGKDILTTHAVYWPTMLMSAKISLPKTIFAHGWWLYGDEKMSKSKGNVINPLDIIDTYGVDSLRFFLMRDMILGQDSKFTPDIFISRYNSDLANDLGNLVGRISTLIKKYFNNEIPSNNFLENYDKDFIKEANIIDTKVHENISQYNINQSLELIFSLIRSINKYLEVSQPWKHVKNDKNKVASILYTSIETLRIAINLLFPIMPTKIKNIYSMIGLNEQSSKKSMVPGTSLGLFKIPFPKIEQNKNNKKTEDEKMSEDYISIDEFKKVDLRTAKIIKAEKVEKTNKLIKMLVELDGTKRQIVSGIAEHYDVDDLIGKMVVIVANLKPVVIRGEESNGMLLAISNSDNKVIVLTSENEEITSGLRLT
ncbi:MAG: methionine--tRNA ligase [Candidatus Marinimicrobia bacterium]|nr:methionine--tRNA ligase [Candidatus Neomarinimicrobiota bacterium]|tara:strand:- start:1281 stop:3140 length:1860 start_codon:yes stop_codon:yes gene_type:complete